MISFVLRKGKMTTGSVLKLSSNLADNDMRNGTLEVLSALLSPNTPILEEKTAIR